MNDKKKKALADLDGALNFSEDKKKDISSGTVQELYTALLAEPSAKKRRKMISDFTVRHAEAAAFLADNEELINAEAEMALVSAAVGGTHIERQISYKGGRKTVTTKTVHTKPDISALSMLLKNRMPDKYSDKPSGEIEIEDVTEVKEVLYGKKAENEGG
ncbi:MAG: hypothetical protein IJ446_09015 [Oscillospiraceae bacterium]|nr:hypothetical protein [Oscillospiraceae bacterium]